MFRFIKTDFIKKPEVRPLFVLIGGAIVGASYMMQFKLRETNEVNKMLKMPNEF